MGEMLVARSVADLRGHVAGWRRGGETGGIDLIHRRHEQQIDAAPSKDGAVAVLVAGIVGQILGIVELPRVHEQGDDHPVVGGARRLDQRQMPRVQRAHRRHHRHGLAPAPPAGDMAAQIRNAARHLHFTHDRPLLPRRRG